MKILLLPLLLAFATNARAQADLFDDPVVAEGKGFAIKKSKFESAFVAYRANLATRSEPFNESLRTKHEASLLDRLVLAELLKLRATDADREKSQAQAQKYLADQGAKNDPAALRRNLMSMGVTLVDYTNRVTEQALSDEVMSREIKNTIVITDAEIRAFHGTNEAQFREPERARVQHFFAASRNARTGEALEDAAKAAARAKIETGRQRVAAGEDFQKVALEISEDIALKDNKGEIRITRARDEPRTALMPEFEAAAFGLRPGQISELITSSIGFHVIKLLELIPARVVPVTEVRDRIEQQLKQQELEKRLPPWFEKLRAEAEVKIKEARLVEPYEIFIRKGLQDQLRP